MNPSPRMMETQTLSTRQLPLITLLLASLSAFTAQAASPPQDAPPPATFVYTANQISNTISAFRLTGNGRLTPVPGEPFAAEAFPVAIAHSADGQYLYNVNQGAASISGYRINRRTGVLTPLPGSPYATPFPYPDAITLSSDGLTAYITAEDDNLLLAWQRDPETGVLRTDTAQTVTTGRHPIAIALTPDQRMALVANFDDDSLSVFNIDQGRLSAERQVIATEEHPIHISISRNGRFAYVANYGSTTVSAFRIEGGQLAEISGSPFFAGAQPYSVVIDPHQETLYSANWGSHDVSAFHIDQENGQLAELKDFRFRSGWFPYDIVVSPDDRHVYVANNGESTISLYNRDSEGELTTISTPIDSDLGPYAMTIVGLGRQPGYR